MQLDLTVEFICIANAQYIDNKVLKCYSDEFMGKKYIDLKISLKQVQTIGRAPLDGNRSN